MSLRDAFRGFTTGLRKGPMVPVRDLDGQDLEGVVRVVNSSGIVRVKQPSPSTVQVKQPESDRPTVPGKTKGGLRQRVRVNTSGQGPIAVVDTLQPPTQDQVPGSWSRYWLGPGQPFTPIEGTAREQDKEKEPRSFQYVTSVNSTISPRLAYGLMPFSDLRTYAEMVPEVAMCQRLLTEELKSFIPTILDAQSGTSISGGKYEWMTKRPDGFNPWPVWLSRFMYNVLVYDAGTSYMMRDEQQQVHGSRVIDGSTIFVLIDEKGEQPRPPAPAFTQVIWGVPKMFLNTYQLWYKPRHLRADAPYGRSPIEDTLPAVKLLASLWDYEFQKYQVGNIPELLVTVPDYWKDNADQILDYEEAFNQRMSGNNPERVRVRFVPAGMTVLQTKEVSFNQESYDAATNAVRMAYGVVQSEVGDAPEGGLGGKGYAEAMESAFYRMGLAPLIDYLEGHFNDILTMNGDEELYQFKLEFPPESLDPTKEEEKTVNRWAEGIIRRDEARQALKLKPLGGEDGKTLVTPGGGPGEEGGPGGMPGGDGKGDGQPVSIGGSDGKKISVTPGTGQVYVNNRIPVRPGRIGVRRNIPVSRGVRVSKAVTVGELEKRFDPNEARDPKSGKWIAEGGGEEGVPDEERQRAAKQEASERLKRRLLGPSGGFTYDPVTSRSATEGYSVSPFPERESILDREQVTPKAIRSYIEANQDAFQSVPGAHVGGWFDPETGKCFLDVSIVVKDPGEAEQLRQKHNQFAYFDLKNKVSVYGPGRSTEEIKKAMDQGLRRFELPEDPTDEELEQFVAALQGWGRGEDVEKAVALGWPELDLVKHCGVCAEDDQYFGQPIKQAVEVKMPHQGANDSFIVAIGGDTMESRPAVWKPKDGEDPKLTDWCGGDLYRRAEAAYLLDRELAPDENHYLVPVTYIDDLDGQVGSVQHYLKQRRARASVQDYGAEWSEQAAVLDYVMGQLDRKDKNWFTHPEQNNRPVLIDSDIAFPTKVTPARSSWVDEWAGKALSTQSIDSLYLLLGNRGFWDDLQESLGDAEAVRLTRDRAELLHQQRMIPTPSGMPTGSVPVQKESENASVNATTDTADTPE